MMPFGWRSTRGVRNGRPPAPNRALDGFAYFLGVHLARASFAFSLSGGADLSKDCSTRGLDFDPLGRPGFLGRFAAVAPGLIRTADMLAHKCGAPASASASAASTFTTTSSATEISNPASAPVEDPSSLFKGRSGARGRVTASTSRERRGRRYSACRGGAEQCAGASSGVAVMMPRKTTGLCGVDMAEGVGEL